MEFEVLRLMCGSCVEMEDRAARNVDWPSGVGARVKLELRRGTNFPGDTCFGGSCFDGAIEDVGFEVTVRMAPSNRPVAQWTIRLRIWDDLWVVYVHRGWSLPSGCAGEFVGRVGPD